MYYKGFVPSLSLSKSQSRQSPNPMMIDRADPRIPSSIFGEIPKFPNPPILESPHHRLVRSPDPPIPPIPPSQSPDPDPPIIIDRPDPFEKMYYNEPEDLLEKGRALLKTGGADAAAAAAAQLSEIDEEDPPQPRKLNPRTARWLNGEDDTQLVWLSGNYLSSYTITHLTQLNRSPVQALHHFIKNQQAQAFLAKELDLFASWFNPDPAAPPLDPRNDGNWKKMASRGRARGALTGFCLLIALSMIFLV